MKPGARLIDALGGEPVEGSVVVVESGAVTFAGRAGDLPSEPGTRVLDANGAVIMPGIIDCHVHLGGTSLPDEIGWVLEPDPYKPSPWSGRWARCIGTGQSVSAHRTHLRGTTVAAMIGDPRVVARWRDVSR